MKGPGASDVAGWISAVEDELTQIEAALAPLVEKQAALIERLGLLKRLLASVAPVESSAAGLESSGNGGVPPARAFASVRERVQVHATEILAEVGRPLHINELHAEFVKRGFEVPGAGKPNNITVHLSDHADVQSPSRGYYEIKGVGSHSTLRYPVVDQSRKKQSRG